MELNNLQEEFLLTLEKSMGIVSSTLKKMDIPREEYEMWLKNVEFKRRIDGINDASLDFVENQLLKQIREGDLAAIQFYLKTKGKKRGY
jgi:hypothetical protein